MIKPGENLNCVTVYGKKWLPEPGAPKKSSSHWTQRYHLSRMMELKRRIVGTRELWQVFGSEPPLKPPEYAADDFIGGLLTDDSAAG